MSKAPMSRKPVNPDGYACDTSIKDQSTDNSIVILHEAEQNMPKTEKEKGSQQQNVNGKENTISAMNGKHKTEKASDEVSPSPHNSDDEVILEEEVLDDDRSKEQGKL